MTTPNRSWEDLLFDYVTGSLAPTDYPLFQAMLAEDPARARDLVAMQRLKSVVREEADMRMEEVPPLSSSFYSELDAVGRMPTDPLADAGATLHSMPPVSVRTQKSMRRVQVDAVPRSTRRTAPLTIAIAAALVILVGAVLFLLRGSSGNDQTATALGTASAEASVSATVTPIPSSTPPGNPVFSVTQTPQMPNVTPFIPDPLQSITPSINSPIVSAPAQELAQSTMPSGDAALSINWLPDDTLVIQGFTGAWLYDNADLSGPVRLLPANENGFVEVAASPDGTRIVTLGWDRELSLWDAATGGRIASITSNQLWDRLTMNADASVIISRLERGVIRVEQAADGTVTLENTSMDAYDYTYNTYLSPDGATLALLSTTTTDLQFVDFATGEQLAVAVPEVPDFPRSAAFSPDGTLFAVGRDDGVIRVYDVATGELTHSMEHGGRAGSVIVNADNTLVAAVIENRPLYTLRVWNLRDGSVYTTVTFDQQMGEPAFNSAGDQLALGTPDGRVVLVDVGLLK